MVGADSAPYGFVVESVNVSVLLYVPVRRASLAPMACLKATVTGSLLTGPVIGQQRVGLAEPPTAASAPPVPAGLVAAARSGCGRLNAPLTSLPVCRCRDRRRYSVASPAVLITFAVVLASYSFATPGVNAPNVAGAPSVSDSVAGHRAADPALRAERAVDELRRGRS